jgi:hypothetical protein
MRRLVLILLVLGLGVPAGALAVRDLPGDGTLVVDNARGLVVVRARGGIIGRFDSGRLIVNDPIEGDGSGPIVYGADRFRELGPHTTLYIGEDIRFRLIGGSYRVQIQAVGADVSAVGRGTVTLDGSGFAEQPGRFQVNGSGWQPMPDGSTQYTLGSGTQPASNSAPEKDKTPEKEKPGPVIPHGQ